MTAERESMTLQEIAPALGVEELVAKPKRRKFPYRPGSCTQPGEVIASSLGRRATPSTNNGSIERR